MNQSWSVRLFLHINKQVGRWPVVDRMVVGFATYLVFVLGMCVLVTWLRTDVFGMMLVRCGSMLIVAMALSYAIALLWQQPRPIRTYPHIKMLIRTMGTWKTFPSDHTIFATIIAYAGVLTFSGWPLVVFLCGTALVPVARIWVGVHYPRDILGGMGISLLVIACFERFVFG